MSTLDVLEASARSVLLDLQSFEAGFAKLPGSGSTNTCPLSRREEQILELYDRLDEIRVECSLLEAQNKYSQEGNNNNNAANDLDKQIKTAEREVLEAQAAYSLKKKIMEAVLTTEPILNAVHGSEKAEVREKELLPQINRRDQLSITHTNLSSTLSNISSTFSATEVENILSSRKNIELTNTLLDLVQEAKSQDKANIQDAKSLKQLEVLERELKFRKARWRIMKRVISAVIVGSGLDWDQDNTLRPLVIDDEDGLS